MRKKHFKGKSSISGLEYALLKELKKTGLSSFTSRQASQATGWPKAKTNQILSRLARKKIVGRVGRGRYTMRAFADTSVEEAVQKTTWPSYLSHWTALRKHNLTEQLPRTIFLTTTKKSGETTAEGFKVKYIKVKPYRFFGYENIGGMAVAEKEKALVESLLQPKYAGGTGEASNCLKEAWPHLNQKKLAEYALRMKNKTLLKRLGWLTEKHKLKAEDNTIKKLRQNMGSGYSVLDPQKPKEGSCDRRWLLIINTRDSEL